MSQQIRIIIFFTLLMRSTVYGQSDSYRYERKLEGITEQWHKIPLPLEIFDRLSPDLADIRIYGITDKQDTVTAPYILRLATEKVSSNQVDFKTINESHNNAGYFFTFEIPSEKSINSIKLDFKRKNFDWKLQLEGSQNQQAWFMITDDYRILSIHNKDTDYQFTSLRFPGSKYRYLRLKIESKTKPMLSSASISQQDITGGIYKNYAVQNSLVFEDKLQKKTIVDVDLKSTVPVSYLEIPVKDSFDFYRPIVVKHVIDSLKTSQGIKYSYRTLASGTVSSLEANIFKFKSTMLNKISIEIGNYDNTPLNLDAVVVKGYAHELVARFTSPASYFVTYGNNRAKAPDYDIAHFTDKIPTQLSSLTMSKEITKKALKSSVQEPLFKNKAWLWSIMGIIILLLGWFSIKMMNNKSG